MPKRDWKNLSLPPDQDMSHPLTAIQNQSLESDSCIAQESALMLSVVPVAVYPSFSLFSFPCAPRQTDRMVGQH